MVEFRTNISVIYNFNIDGQWPQTIEDETIEDEHIYDLELSSYINVSLGTQYDIGCWSQGGLHWASWRQMRLQLPWAGVE